MVYFSAACGCDRGLIRRRNEDNFYFNGYILPCENEGLDSVMTQTGTSNQPVLFGIFDGMGGESFGNEAAYLAADVMSKRLSTKPKLPEALVDVCMNANYAICRAAQKHGGETMGATAVLLGLEGENAYLVNIGDSRAFLYRNGGLTQISVDHTEQLPYLWKDKPKYKPRLTQHLGIKPEDMVIEPYATEIRIESGDLFLLCSDGLTDMVNEDEICLLIREDENIVELTERLLDRAVYYGGKDNITIV